LNPLVDSMRQPGRTLFLELAWHRADRTGAVRQQAARRAQRYATFSFLDWSTIAPLRSRRLSQMPSEDGGPKQRQGQIENSRGGPLAFEPLKA
jgi:hypothetical protein